MAKVRESIEAIRTSPEVHKLLVTSASVAGSAIRHQAGALDALVRKATGSRQDA